MVERVAQNDVKGRKFSVVLLEDGRLELSYLDRGYEESDSFTISKDDIETLREGLKKLEKIR